MAEKAASSAASWPLSSQHLDWSLAQLQQHQNKIASGQTFDAREALTNNIWNSQLASQGF